MDPGVGTQAASAQRRMGARVSLSATQRGGEADVDMIHSADSDINKIIQRMATGGGSAVPGKNTHNVHAIHHEAAKRHHSGSSSTTGEGPPGVGGAGRTGRGGRREVRGTRTGGGGAEKETGLRRGTPAEPRSRRPNPRCRSLESSRARPASSSRSDSARAIGGHPPGWSWRTPAARGRTGPRRA